MAKVNGMTEQGQRAYEELAFLVHALRSRFRWTVNIDALAQYAGEGMPLTMEQVKAAKRRLKRGEVPKRIYTPTITEDHRRNKNAKYPI